MQLRAFGHEPRQYRSVLPGGRCAFTLIEVLVVVLVLGILAAIIIPQFRESDDLTRTRVMAAGVRHIRELVAYHAAAGDTALSAQGFPLALDPDWFRNGKLPSHTWTGMPMNVNTVSGNPNDVYPATKTFDPATAGADNAWYNTASGGFCVLVPDQGAAADTLQMFNDANLAQCTALNQTTK